MIINPDGSVTITSSKGRTKIVKPEELGAYGISPDAYTAEKTKYDQQLSSFKETGQVVDPEQARFEEAAKAQGWVKPKTPEQIEKEEATAGSIARQKEALDVTNKILEGSTKGLTGMLRIGGNIAGTQAYTKKQQVEQLRGMLAVESRALLKGQGTISDRELAMLQDMVTSLDYKMNDKDFRAEVKRIQNKFYDTLAKSEEKAPEQYKEVIGEGGLGTPAEAIKKKGDAYDLLYSGGQRESLGGALGDVIGNIGKPEDQQKEIRDITLKDTIVDSLIGATADMWKDVSTAIVLRGKTGKELDKTLTADMDIAQRALERAEQETDPEIKARLEKIAFEVMNEVSKQRGEINKLWSESKDTPYALRALGVSGEMSAVGAGVLNLKDLGVKMSNKVGEKVAQKSAEKAGTETVETIAQETGKTLGKKPSLVARAGQTIKNLNPVKVLSEKQSAEAAKITEQVNTDLLESAAKNMAKKSAADATAYKNLSPSIKETKSVTKLLENLRYWGEQSFTTSGAVKDKAQARVASALYHSGVEQLKTLAPEAYKYRQLLAYTFKMPKTAGKWLWRLFLGKGIFGGLGN